MYHRPQTPLPGWEGWAPLHSYRRNPELRLQLGEKPRTGSEAVHNLSPADLNCTGELQLTPNWCGIPKEHPQGTGDEGLAEAQESPSSLPRARPSSQQLWTARTGTKISLWNKAVCDIWFRTCVRQCQSV